MAKFKKRNNEAHESKSQDKKERMAKKLSSADKMYNMLKDPKHLRNVSNGKAKEAYEKKHSVLD